MVEDNHLAFRRPGYGVNHWPTSYGDLDEELSVYTGSTLCDGRISSHNGCTDVQKFKDILRRYKTQCKLTSAINHLYTVNVPAAYQDLIALDPLNLSQDRVQINVNTEPHICELPSKLAHKLDLLLGVTIYFGNLVIYEHQLQRAFKQCLFSILDDCLINQLPGSATRGGSLLSLPIIPTRL